MNYRAAAQKLAGGLSSDMSMDPANSTGNDVDSPASSRTVQPDPSTDGMDPATPGGPAPMNGAEPFGDPVATDPELLPPGTERSSGPVPYQPGPNLDTTTIHNARRASYEAKHNRERSP